MLFNVALALAQGTLRLNLKDAEKLALQNNPQFTSAKLTAAAAYEVPKQFSANFQPSVTGNFTSVGADDGSRLAAGSLNNPIVYSRLGSGCERESVDHRFWENLESRGISQTASAGEGSNHRKYPRSGTTGN